MISINCSICGARVKPTAPNQILCADPVCKRKHKNKLSKLSYQKNKEKILEKKKLPYEEKQHLPITPYEQQLQAMKELMNLDSIPKTISCKIKKSGGVML